MGLFTRKMERNKKEKIRIALDIILMVIFILWSFQIAQSYRDCSVFLCGSNATVYCKPNQQAFSIYGANNTEKFCNESGGLCVP